MEEVLHSTFAAAGSVFRSKGEVVGVVGTVHSSAEDITAMKYNTTENKGGN